MIINRKESETMSPSTRETLSKLTIAPENKSRRRMGPVALLILVVAVIGAGFIIFTATGKTDRKPVPSSTDTTTAENSTPTAPANTGDVVLTVSDTGLGIPEEIRGYGHVKERHLKAARVKWDGLMVRWRAVSSRWTRHCVISSPLRAAP
jgi:hypothetical protein